MSKRSRGARASSPSSTPAPAASGAGKGTPTAADASSAAQRPAPATPGRTTSSAASSSGADGTSRRRISATAPRSPLERYRNVIVGAAVVAVVAIGGVFLFLGATGPAYACETILEPAAAASAAPDATPRLGQVTRDLGRPHVDVGEKVTYEFCPPTSGPHYNDSRFGPIPTRVYGADDKVDPQGWIHNLEHGQMTVLYRCPEGCDETAQAALRALQQQLPPSPLCEFPADRSVPVVRFDDLPTPYAAVVWGRVLFLDTLDVAQVVAFAEQSADRGPEPQCQAALPGATAAPSATPAP